MKWKLSRPRAFFNTIRENFFLRPHQPQPSTLEILRSLYPSVNWNRVDFYEGLPWFTPLVAPYVNAQALPNFYSFGRFRIYLRKFDESRAQCLADVVHEAFHIMQAMHFRNGYGFGFFRGWLLFYIAHFLREGYRNNVFEIPAYDQEFRFLKACQKHGLKGISPRVEETKLRQVIREETLIFPKYEYKYSGPFWVLPASFIICVIVSVFKPPVDLLIYILSFPVRKKLVHAAEAAASRRS